MTIGIDANCLIFAKAGVGKYSQNIIKNLLKIDQKNQYFLYFAYLRHGRQREEQIKKLLPQRKNVTWRIFPLPAAWYEFLTSTPLPIKNLIKDNLDVFFAPYAAGIPRSGFAKMAVTIHDLVFLRFPEHRGRRLSHYYLKRHQIAAEKSKKLIVPSKATKKDLIDFLKVDRRKIQVIYEAADERFKPLPKNGKSNLIIKKYFDPNIKYILTVATLEPRKNLVKLLAAYCLLPFALQRQYQLVIVGAKGWQNNLFYQTIENLNLKEKVILTGFVLDEDLLYIYNRARVFVYPSLYEGFGLPPLEALACGVPVICANNSSLPEVVGKAAWLVDENSEEEMAAALKKVILRPQLAQKMVARGFAQAKKFSWGVAARQTLKVLENL